MTASLFSLSLIALYLLAVVQSSFPLGTRSESYSLGTLIGRNAGLSLDQQCADSGLEHNASSIFENTTQLVEAGLNLANNPQSMAYQWFFQDADVGIVKRVLEDILGLLSGQGKKIILRCDITNNQLYDESSPVCVLSDDWNYDVNTSISSLCLDTLHIGFSPFWTDEQICSPNIETHPGDYGSAGVEVALIRDVAQTISCSPLGDQEFKPIKNLEDISEPGRLHSLKQDDRASCNADSYAEFCKVAFLLGEYLLRL